MIHINQSNQLDPRLLSQLIVSASDQVFGSAFPYLRSGIATLSLDGTLAFWRNINGSDNFQRKDKLFCSSYHIYPLISEIKLIMISLKRWISEGML